jgi:hypothetical protein
MGSWGVNARRCALLVIAASLSTVLIALPATASAKAKATTKLKVSSEFVVDNSVAGVTPSAPVATVKLYRKYDGVYIKSSGVVRCYFEDPDTGENTLVATATGSVVSFKLAKRGDYIFTYGGNHSRKACIAYTTRVDDVGLTLSDPDISITPIEGTDFSTVAVAYGVSWNSDVYTGKAFFTYASEFTTGTALLDSSDLNELAAVIRTFKGPQTLEFTYKVRTSEAVGDLVTLAWVTLYDDDDYVYGGTETNSYLFERDR